VEVRWPSGQVDVLRDVPARQLLRVREGQTATPPPPTSSASLAALSLLDLEDRPVQPMADPAAKAFVFLFVGTECPISNRYAPEIRRLRDAFQPKGVAFRLVYAEASATVLGIRGHLAAYDLGSSALRDPEHALVKAAQARVTPEAAVFVPGPTGPHLVYHGRIDDRYVDVGRERRAPTTRDLEEAIGAILAGRPVPRASTPAVGCFLADAR
jgi:hypothetical protein